MSAETLRKAAALMRERPETPWAPAVADWLDDIAGRHQRVEINTVAISEDGREWQETAIQDETGMVVASTEPVSTGCTHRPQDELWPCPEIAPALTVARAYLGDDA